MNTVLEKFHEAIYLINEIDISVALKAATQDVAGALITVRGKVQCNCAKTGHKQWVQCHSKFMVKWYIGASVKDIAIVILDEFASHRRTVIRRELDALLAENEAQRG